MMRVISILPSALGVKQKRAGQGEMASCLAGRQRIHVGRRVPCDGRCLVIVPRPVTALARVVASSGVFRDRLNDGMTAGAVREGLDLAAAWLSFCDSSDLMPPASSSSGINFRHRSGVAGTAPTLCVASYWLPLAEQFGAGSHVTLCGSGGLGFAPPRAPGRWATNVDSDQGESGFARLPAARERVHWS